MDLNVPVLSPARSPSPETMSATQPTAFSSALLRTLNTGCKASMIFLIPPSAASLSFRPSVIFVITGRSRVATPTTGLVASSFADLPMSSMGFFTLSAHFGMFWAICAKPLPNWLA